MTNEQKAMLEADAQTASWEAARGMLQRADAVAMELKRSTGMFNDLCNQYFVQTSEEPGSPAAPSNSNTPKYTVGSNVTYN